MKKTVFVHRTLLVLSVAAVLLGFTFALVSPAHAGLLSRIFSRPVFSHPIFSGPVAKLDLSPGLQAGKVDDAGFLDAEAMRAFYAARNDEPLWSGNDTQRAEAAKLETYWEQSWTQGLNPDTYHVDAIRDLLKQKDPLHQASLELLVTDAVVRFGHDVTGMRLRPAAIGQDQKYWRKSMAASAVLDVVGKAGQPADAVEALAPQDKGYQALQAELVRLVRQDKALPASSPHPKALARSHAVLRVKMEQIIANLERLRWLDQTKPDRYVLVNIPQQMLWGIDHGKPEMQMEVVVGKVERPTMSFKTDITGVRFNPRWTVPDSIKVKDFLPILVNDPSILADKGIALYRVEHGNRVTVDPAQVDWKSVTPDTMKKFHMVQTPGYDNSLGLIRVLMPDDYDIYLHDTNHRDLFVQNKRFFSSGCVRLSDPVTMAHFILEDHKGWSDDQMQKLVDKGAQTDIAVDHPLPIYLVYLTTWSGAQGQVIYGEDVYGWDKRLVEALKAAHAYSLPGDNIKQSPVSGETHYRNKSVTIP